MKRDSLLMIVSVTGLATAFLLGIVLPGRKSTARQRRAIASAEQAIRSVPVRVAELRSIEREIETRESDLFWKKQLVPEASGVDGILQQVATLAEDAGVRITRLEPLPPAERRSYTALPFRLSIRGPFPAAARFLRGLENRPRLFTVEEFSMRREEQESATQTQADLYFSVYVMHSERTDSAESHASSTAEGADTGIR